MSSPDITNNQSHHKTLKTKETRNRELIHGMFEARCSKRCTFWVFFFAFIDSFARAPKFQNQGEKMSDVKKCSYALCDSPADGSRYLTIEAGKNAGGKDWSSLVGNTLCMACYSRYRDRGTLERRKNKPLPDATKRCTYELCDSPNEAGKFFRIEEGKTSGGKDWSSLVGSILCQACYSRYRQRGTLARTDKKNYQRFKLWREKAVESESPASKKPKTSEAVPAAPVASVPASTVRIGGPPPAEGGDASAKAPRPAAKVAEATPAKPVAKATTTATTTTTTTTTTTNNNTKRDGKSGAFTSPR